jgi:D-alanyl-D-alanine carboxypeptidase
VAALAAVVAVAACGSAPQPPARSTTTPSAATPSAAAPSAAPSETALPHFGIGAFPDLPAGELPSDVGAALQTVLDDSVDLVGAPGLAAAVVVADRGWWAGAAGTSDGTEPLDPAAQFGIGSVTKTVIAAQVLKLVESGAVDLDRPIDDYLGGTDLQTNGATVRQVLGMRSGIGEVDADPRAACSDLARSFSMDELRRVTLEPPSFEPGAQFRYTNANFVLAGILIEEVTGSTVGQVLRSGVLANPSLERLIYQDAEKPTPPVAAPFVVLSAGAAAPEPNDLLRLGGGYLPARCLASSAGPAGGMASDARTLAAWGYLLYGGWVLGDDELAEMTTFESGYGLGAHDQASRFGVPALGHEGTVPGYTTQLLAFPDDGIAVVVLMNTNGSEESLTILAGNLRGAITD